MSEELGDGLEFEPGSYEEGSAELAQAHSQLGGAAGYSAGVQGQAGDAMRGWPPTAAVGEVSDTQLRRRLGRPVLDRSGRPRLKGNGFVRSVGHIDPVTGTTTDSISGLPHRSGSITSRFDSAADFVHADSVLRARADATGVGLQKMPIAELFGEDGHTRMTGFYIDPANPRAYHPVNFEGGSVAAVYDFGRDGKPFLITMYPEAARWMHP